ncbi:MAG: UrcA family protein, partial [Brevundimonas sp.]
MKSLLTRAALLLAIAAPCGAQAQAASDPARTDAVAVSFADLDLDQAAGARILNNRLRT